VNQGEPLHDWEATFKLKYSEVKSNDIDAEKASEEGIPPEETRVPCKIKSPHRLHIDVNRAYGFIEAHREARKKFRLEFCQTLETTSESEKLLLKESERETDKAEAFLNAQDPVALRHIEGLLMCGVLLDKAVRHVEKTFNDGILSATEAGELIEEIEEEFIHLRNRKASTNDYPEEMDQEQKENILHWDSVET